MTLIPDIVAAKEELTHWRRELHAHPELAFEESRTTEFVATQLVAFSKATGQRADMDALAIDL